MKNIRLIIIEDNRVLREGLIALLEELDGIKLLAATGASSSALEVLQLKPQVVLLNRGLQKQSCMQVLKKIRKEAPEAGVVVMDLMPGQTDVMEFVQAGVSGFILSNATLDDFTMTIRAVAKGEKVLPDPLTNSLFSQIVANVVNAENPPSLKKVVKMTKREQEIIALIGRGMSNKEIAQNLNLATHTIKSHVHNILEKLALHSRLQVAAFSHNQKDPGRKSAD
ncbi:LuxR C-terminal-related transcriptional regulator [Thermodesulfobacteriota bacterium]